MLQAATNRTSCDRPPGRLVCSAAVSHAASNRLLAPKVLSLSLSLTVCLSVCLTPPHSLTFPVCGGGQLAVPASRFRLPLAHSWPAAAAGQGCTSAGRHAFRRQACSFGLCAGWVLKGQSRPWWVCYCIAGSWPNSKLPPGPPGPIAGGAGLSDSTDIFLYIVSHLPLRLSHTAQCQGC